MVGQLAGGIAHDFNNVLSAIMMANDFLLNAHKPTDPSFQDIMQIKQNATRAATLVRQLLAFSRRQTLRPQVLDLGDALSDLTMLLRRLIGEKVKLDLVHGRDLWPVKVDVSQFEQVIVNLAVNARDAMPEGGTLTVKTGNVTADDAAQLSYKGMPAADYVRIDVVDSGTGIPADDHRQDLRAVLLDQGSRQGHRAWAVDRVRHRQADRRFRLCRFRSGPGTAFHIFLPRHRPELEAAARAAGAPTVRPRAPQRGQKPKPDLTGQGTILLVEDEDGLRALNARGLRSRGYSVIEAANGVEAIEALAEKDGGVDLVVSDVVMPEMDGPTMLKEMRAKNPEPEDHLRVRLCRGRLREEPAGKPAIRLPAKALHAGAAGGGGEGNHDAVVSRLRDIGERGRTGLMRGIDASPRPRAAAAVPYIGFTFRQSCPS